MWNAREFTIQRKSKRKRKPSKGENKSLTERRDKKNKIRTIV